jgi:hypothetical protein
MGDSSPARQPPNPPAPHRPLTFQSSVFATLVTDAAAREGIRVANRSPVLPTSVVNALIELHDHTPGGCYAGFYAAEILEAAKDAGVSASLDDLWAASDFSKAVNEKSFKSSVRQTGEAYAGRLL